MLVIVSGWFIVLCVFVTRGSAPLLYIPLYMYHSVYIASCNYNDLNVICERDIDFLGS